MITLFGDSGRVYAVESANKPEKADVAKLEWLFSGARLIEGGRIEGRFVGPRKEMVTPWSTNAVEITQNMGIAGIIRIEEFSAEAECDFDPMLNRLYDAVGQDVFEVDLEPEPVKHIDDIAAYNKEEGLALSDEEIAYLECVAEKMGRPLTDSEVFGFSQVNSEHCRHKIFNGEFVVDGVTMPDTLFSLIKKTTRTNPGQVVSAYKDNCAFLQGPKIEQWAPRSGETSDFYAVREIESVISIKAETHNFPTTVEPFNGAATGSGGEIRDRIAGGKGAFPLAGTAVYMTAYPRLGREWDNRMAERKWLYQTPEQILIKASNGASDFGNKFGQPLLCGSVLTFEHEENGHRMGYDKVIMQAGGVGFGRKADSIKDVPKAGDRVVVMGGDNYRIGMGGGAVSSVATGEYSNAVELNAIQRSNPEMQRRVYNAIRAVSEQEHNPVVSIHDHGAGGHLNCLSELVEETGGRIEIDKLPVGDPTLSGREIIGNESQERMGLVVEAKDVEHLRRVAERERAPIYDVGETTGDGKFTFEDTRNGEKPIDWPLEYMFGSAPKTVMNDVTVNEHYKEPSYKQDEVAKAVEKVLRLEAVACKDWLVNKVDRSVGGKTVMQQTAGKVQLPVNDCAVVALDYSGITGIATSLGHAPVAGLADAAAGSRLAITESLTNIIFAPLTHGLKGISLSANWMWPTRNKGEDVRLYEAVKAASDFALALEINIPTGKDSLSMTQKYPGGDKVVSPGTVIITAAAEVSDIRKCVSPALRSAGGDMVYVDLSGGAWGLGGSSFAQAMGAIGMDVPTVDAENFARGFKAVQGLINKGAVLAGHDVSAGGLVTALLEMTFTDNNSGMRLDLSGLGEKDLHKLLFSERPAVVLQVADGGAAVSGLARAGVRAFNIGVVTRERKMRIGELTLDIDKLRDAWYETSYLLDRAQSGEEKAAERRDNFAKNPLEFRFPEGFTGKHSAKKTGVKAAVIREKGCQCERETAWMMNMAGMEVKDVHMTDLISGRETLEDVNFIAFVGGFSNSDVLGSAKGWAGAFLYNKKAKQALENFYARPDTMSLGICNGCQLMVELGLVGGQGPIKMLHNDTHRFESAFIGVDIAESNSIMLSSLKGARLGIWIAHGEGKFSLPASENTYNIAMKYCSGAYPANPNGSDHNVAAIASPDGRHLAMMPHLERAIRPWNWAHYPEERNNDEVSPWVEAFDNAARWVRARTGQILE